MKPFVVRTTGGSAAQLLGLITAIYLGQFSRRNFAIRHSSVSTGTYWPWSLEGFVNREEFEPELINTKDIDLRKLRIGRLVEDHGLKQAGINREKVLKLVRSMKLEFPLRWLLGELAIEARPSRLRFFSNRITEVSGGYFPLFDSAVMRELDIRFVNAKRSSPFREFSTRDYIAIHYRLGDKRASRRSGFDKDGIIDPIVFSNLLESYGTKKDLPVFVISDEPELATQLLASVGVKAIIPSHEHDFWLDLNFLVNAKILLGSWSQVSQLAALFSAARNDGS